MEYKNIRYPIATDPLSIETASLNQATDVDAEIAAIRKTGMVNVKANLTDTTNYLTDTVFAQDGTAVWDTSIGAEVRRNAAGGRTVTTGMVPIPVASVVPTGGGSFDLNSINGFSFNGCTAVYINNIFTPEFSHYKIYYNVSASVGGQYYVAYSTDGAGMEASNISRASFWSNGATLTRSGGAGNLAAPIQPGSTAMTQGNFEIMMANPLSAYYSPLTMWTSGQISGGVAGVSMGSSVFNAATSPTYDGLVLRSSAGNLFFSGSFKIYGYPNSDEPVPIIP